MTLFNDGWIFAKVNTSEDSPSDECYSPVEIPHDWLISDTHNLYKSSVGYYKKIINTASIPADKRVYICFDGVMMDSTLYVNDTKVGEWKYGYTAFEFEITDFLIASSDNTLLLEVNYRSPCSRWYTGAGIYRDVFLIVKSTEHFLSDGIYITPRKNENNQWTVEVQAEATANCDNYELRHIITANDIEITQGLFPLFNQKTTQNAPPVFLKIENGKLWDIENPFLYQLKSELIVNGQITDTVITRFGLREIDFKPDSGFYLNSRKLKLNGVCQHHDLGALGAAVNRDAMRRQLAILRNMGVNAIRTSHNPFSRSFMELADEMGFLVLSELLDMWRLPKNKYDYARFFDDWIEKDVAAWIRRDRNCPSVIMWSIGNEIYDTHADYETGSATMRLLMDLVKKHDPNEHAPVTLCSNYMPWENTQKCADIIKLIGYNYAEELYHIHHAEHPDWVIYGAETASIVQSRGVYHFPLSKEILHDDDLQCSALGNSRTSWGAESVEKCINDDRDATFSLGTFPWTGFDYIGEPTPYHTKNSYFGHVDTAGFPKDSYYIFKSAWTDYKADPFIHVYPYWDFSPGQAIDVRVCTNAPKAKLYLNGKLIGIFEVDHKTDKKIVGDFIIPYESGELLAIAFDENEHEVARMSRRSFGDAVRLDYTSVIIGELAFCEINAFDKDNNLVENANSRVNMKVENGVLLGMDNGDSTDYDQYTASSRRMWSGKLLAIIKPDSADSFKLHLEIDQNDIPVRKIELYIDGYNVSAKTYPENATYSELVWRLTDRGGIDSPLGTLEIADDKRSATIVPRGDGEVFVRCGILNAKKQDAQEHISLYSQIQLELSGFGKQLLNPYEYITGGLCTHSNVKLTNGNERGIATLRKGESHVGYAGIDFGTFGSDEITLSLFPLSREPFNFEIWEGMPELGGELICSPLYDKGSTWNTYKQAAYKLPRKLKNVTTLCLVFDLKVHIGGFVFTKQYKAYEKLYMADNDFVYGDSYTVKEQAIERIGNNVTIGFNNMDFGNIGSDTIEICLRCKHKNSFQVFLTDENGDTTSNMIEAKPSEEYAPLAYKLSKIAKGTKNVSLVFLPGCDIDIEWIKFTKMEEMSHGKL